jgi:hypothetical protein
MGDEKWSSCKKGTKFLRRLLEDRDVSLCRFGESNCNSTVSVGATGMSSSAEQGYAAEWYSGESGSSGSRDVPTGNSLRGTSALQDLRRTTIADLPENLSSAVRQREDHLPSGSAVWKAGHCLVDRYEYGQAAEYFSRMLHSSDRLTVEAAEVAVQLCAALSRE